MFSEGGVIDILGLSEYKALQYIDADLNSSIFIMNLILHVGKILTLPSKSTYTSPEGFLKIFTTVPSIQLETQECLFLVVTYK